jgi:pyruvate,water dikinase
MGIAKGFNILSKLIPRRQRPSRDAVTQFFRFKYESFKELLNSNSELLNIIANIEDKLQGRSVFGMSFIKSQSVLAVFHTLRMVKRFDDLSGGEHRSLFKVIEDINARIKEEIEKRGEDPVTEFTIPYSRITKEMVDWVGEKNANLGEVLNRVHLPVPPGFAITTHAYYSLLDYNDLFDEIDKKKMEIDPENLESVNRVSEEIQKLILGAEVPPELREAIESSYARMMEDSSGTDPSGCSGNVSLRSSALREDSELSFAGQYQSSLNVVPRQLVETYKYIVASLYTPRAVSYRLNKGIRDEDIAMSVACLRMVESVASGVMYSRNPINLLKDDVTITAVWGMGLYAVDGTISPDTYTVAKNGTFTILETRVSHKPVQLICSPDGGLVQIPVDEERRDQPCLSPEQIRTLAEYAVKLEDHYGCPQDIEWALDSEGRLFILQTRPLRMHHDDLKKEVPEITGSPTLIKEGAIASPGIGFGPAFHVRSEQDLTHFPQGAILVAKHSTPQFVIVMQKAQGIVTDFGSATGHMASLAREFGVPAILDTKTATTSIPAGVEITVDAYSGRVYQGRVPELLALRKNRDSQIKDTPVYETLRKVADLIVPLTLLDPKASNFNPQSCQTLHDVMRFVHELSYKYMFQISDTVSDKGGSALKLAGPIPLDLYLIDLGGGLTGVPERARTVTMENIASVPFKALLRGLTHPALQEMGPRPIQLNGFLSVMREQMLSPPQVVERFGDRSYAIISDKYINFSSRVGYHYSVLDAYCGQTVNKNYITFSFKGGAADDVRRNRRARAIALVLKELDFSVDVLGDRVDARFQKHECPLIEERLDIIGRLLQFTRQMDMLMNSEVSVEGVARCFLEGNYEITLDLMCKADQNTGG